MSRKFFDFVAIEMRSLRTEIFSAAGEKLAEAFAAGAAKVRDPAFGPGPLRMFRFGIRNNRTEESTAFIGQGETMISAWSEGFKLTKETFRPRDGVAKPVRGLGVLVAARAGDVHALGRAGSRSVESFEGDETYQAESLRRRREAEVRRLKAEGKVA